MFAFFKRHWARSNPWKWAGLFAFEFVVVLLGVLCAQMLQERFEDRRERARFEATRAVIVSQARSVAEAVVVRDLQKNCVQSNLRQILASVESGQSGDFGIIVNHPARSAPKFDVWSGEVPTLARKYLEPEDLLFFEYIATLNDLLNRELQKEEPLWAHLQLAINGGANLSEAEQLAIKQSVFEIEHFYQAYGGASQQLLPQLMAMGLAPDPDRIIAQHREGAPCTAQVHEGAQNYRAQLRKLSESEGNPNR